MTSSSKHSTVRRRQFVAVVASLGFLATACSRSDNSSSAKSSTTVASATTGAPGATTATTVAGPGPGDFGTLKALCGPGDAKGATDQGVTDTEIRMGTMSDPGAVAAPGLNQELFDSADAFTGWCNAAGGILGRKIKLDKWDAKLTEVPARMIQACGADFALAGNGEALDGTGVDQRVKCGLPEIAAYVVSAAAGSAPFSIQPLVTSNHQAPLTGTYRALAEVDPEAVKHYGVLSSQLQSIKDAGNRDRQAAKQLGYTEVYYDEAPLAVDNYRPYVEALKAKGVQVFSAYSNPINMSTMLKSMQDVGYFPKYILFAGNFYDSALIKNAGTALDQSHVAVSMFPTPFELADQFPAVQQYIDLLTKYANGAKPKSLGVNAMSGWLLWAQSAKACGSNLTRKCLFDNASAVTKWDAGGLHFPGTPGNAKSPDPLCHVVMQATSKGFILDKQLGQPNNGPANCDPRNQLDLIGFPPKQ